MSVSGTAVTTALNALRMYSRQVDRAAESIAAAGLADLSADPPDGEGSPSAPPGDPMLDLPGAMTSMLIAQRAFAAQLRVLRAADEMLRESVESVKR